MSLDILNEAFKRLELLEDTFDTSSLGINKLSQFIEQDDDIDTVDVIDDTVTSDEELSDSYVGKVIIECNVCHSLIFKSEDEIQINEDSIVNSEDECPYCKEQEGFVIVGKIENYDEESSTETDVEDNEDKEETEEDDGDLTEALGIGAGLAIGGAAIGAGNLLGNLFDDLDDEEEDKETLTEDDVEEGLVGDVSLNIDAKGQSVGILNGQGGQVTNSANEALVGDINVSLDASGQSVGLLGGTGGTVTNEGKKTSIDRSKFKRRIRESVEENPLKNLRSNVIEFPNGEYVYIEYKGGKLVAGSATNNGIIPEYETDYDNSVSVDANIQNLYDVITEKNPDLLNEAIKNPDATRNKVIDRLNKSSDKDLVRDLTLCIENDGEVYRRFTTPVIENLKKKYKKGNFDKKLAIQAFYNVVVNALKMPHFDRHYSYSIKSVGVPERYAVAENLLSGSMDEITYDSRKNEAVDVTDQVTISTKESGFITKKKDLESQGYKVIGSGDGQIIMAKPKSIKEGKETLPSSFCVDAEIIDWVDLSDEDEVKDAVTDFMVETYGVEPISFDIDVNDDYVDVINIKWRKPKSIKEGLSYGELTAIESEWNKFKKSKGINGKAEADVAWEFIDTECKGVYDTEDERNDVFGVISTLEESAKLVEAPIYDLEDDEIEFLKNRKTTRVDISDREAREIDNLRARKRQRLQYISPLDNDSWYCPETSDHIIFATDDDRTAAIGVIFGEKQSEIAYEYPLGTVVLSKKVSTQDLLNYIGQDSDAFVNAYIRTDLPDDIDTDLMWETVDNNVGEVLEYAKSVIKGELKKGDTLTEAPYLEPRHDARQSFYNKAFVTDDDNDLYSYGLKVMTIKDGQPVITCPVDRISQTTLRHIKEFLLQNGFKAINKSQILRDYKQEVPTRDIKIDECNKPINEDVRDSHYRDYIYDYFEFSTDDKFLDLIADLLDRVEDFSNEQEVWEAVDSGMIYTQDQWTAYMHYCDMGDPAENMWEGLMGDMLAICSKIADNDTEDADDEPMDESLKESYMRKWKQRFTEGINNATVETDDSKLTMSADENGKVTVTTEPIDSTPDSGEGIAPLSDEEVGDIIDNSVEGEIEEPVDELGEDEIDIAIDEIDEEAIDELGESYMRKIYENVDSFKTHTVHSSNNKFIVEGTITFKSGKTKNTGFIFESYKATKDGRVNFLGENKHFSNKTKIYTLDGVVKNNKLIAESLSYNYRLGKKDVVKGSVKRSK